MSATIVRLLLSVIAVIATPAMYFLVLVVLYESGFTGRGNFEVALHLTNWICGVGLAIVWVTIWAPQVTWTPRRVGMTAAIFLVACVVGAIVGGTLGALTNEEEVGIVTAGIVWALAWLSGTVLLWRETAAERGERLHTLGIRAIACPKCGYNMTGLKQSICPECGASFTLDELFAALKEEKGTLPEESRA